MNIARFKIRLFVCFHFSVDRSRVLQILTCNLQPATCNLQPATCNLQPATCDLQPATCHLQIDPNASVRCKVRFDCFWFVSSEHHSLGFVCILSQIPSVCFGCVGFQPSMESKFSLKLETYSELIFNFCNISRYHCHPRVHKGQRAKQTYWMFIMDLTPSQ